MPSLRRFATLPCLLLAGCHASYTVELHNLTDKPVEARLLQDLLNQDPLQLERASIPPGASSTLGPVHAQYTDDVNLEISQTLELGLPPNRTRLYPGSSTYELVASERAWSGVEIRKRPR